jgi:ABC-type enterobactin transport system, permease component
MSKLWIIRNRLISAAIPVSAVAVMCALIVVVFAIMLISLSVGNQFIGIGQILFDMFSRSDTLSEFIAQSLRFPRVVMSAIVGAALASSGLLLQSMIRNPLASPDVIGITGGASAAAITYLSFFSSTLGIFWLPFFSILGAFSAVLLVYCLAWRNGITPMRLILVGMGISALMGAITTFAIAASPLSTSITAYIWLTGSVYGANWKDVQALLPWVCVSLPFYCFLPVKLTRRSLGTRFRQVWGFLCRV